MTDLDPERAARAAEALSEGVARPRAAPGRPGTYIVPSFTTDATYRVHLEDRTCTCPDHQYRGACCKHILAAALAALTL